MPAKRRRCAGRTAFLFALLLAIPTLAGPGGADGPWHRLLQPRTAYAAASETIVTNPLDVVDGDTSSIEALNATPGDDTAVSLREALLAANATAPGTPLTIGFDLAPGSSGHDAEAGTWRIQPSAALPPLTRGDVTIDGTTQPGAVAGAPAIILDGLNVFEAMGLNNGLTIASARNTVRGLAIVYFYDIGVLISGGNATDNQIVGCWIGTAGGGREPNYVGVEIRGGARNNRLGGPSAAERNLISGNDLSGVLIHGPTTSGNRVSGNWIGTAPSGSEPLGNTFYGVLISNGAASNQIGEAAAGNVISGNGDEDQSLEPADDRGNGIGIFVEGASRNTIAGNLIGVAADGTTPLANENGGVFLVDGASDNVVGGATAGARNVIAANGTPESAYGQGVFVGTFTNPETPAAARNRIQGNFIGVDSGGIVPRGNLRHGILIGGGAIRTFVGGSEAGTGNVITYNGLGGIRIDASDNYVIGNLVGIGADGATGLGNQFHGVRVNGDGNVVGPDNLIAHNELAGVFASGSNNSIQGNQLFANGYTGICVTGLSTNVSANAVIGNGGSSTSWEECPIQSGIVVINTSGTRVSSNEIFDNRSAGITISGGNHNKISSNSISGNGGPGIALVEGGNNGITPPVIEFASSQSVSGRGCALCSVEVFADASGEGRHFLGTTTTDAQGNFSLPIETLPEDFVTATNTDSSDNTSTFANPVSAHGEQPREYRIMLPLVSQ